MLSRMIYGGRISITIGLIGVTISIVLGLFFGGLAGYFGGWIDSVVQRLIEDPPLAAGTAVMDGALRGAAGVL